MNHRSLVFLVACALSSVLAGCGGPQWVVHSQAAPDPFLNQKSFGVLPTDFTGYVVGGKSEAEYLSGKAPDQQASFMADKTAIDDVFAENLISSTGPSGIQVARTGGTSSAPFQIRPVILFLEPGYYAGISAAPAELHMVLRITSPDGKVLDEIEIDKKGKGLATGMRLRDAAVRLGRTAGAYLTSRVTGAAP